MLSYSSIYIPGYTGFIPNLQNVVGETYGNATRKLLDHQAKLLRLSNTAPERRYLLNRTFCKPYERRYAQLIDGRHEYLPSSGNHQHYLARSLTYDGDPHTTSAIQSIERAKADLNPPAKASYTSQFTLTKEVDKTAKNPPSEIPCAQSAKSNSQKISATTSPKADKVQQRDRMPTVAPETQDALRKRRGKLIYRADSGLLPNYTGYIPGHKFSFGKTWGVSTRDSLGTGKRPFIWTSLT